jgi:AraC-like DNA-binding protein
MNRIAEQMLALMPVQGYFPAALDGITLMRSDVTTAPVPVLQEPTIVIMGQGTKRGFLGGDEVCYRPGQCLVVSVPMHFECDTVVDAAGPMLAMTVRIDMALVNELMAKMGPGSTGGAGGDGASSPAPQLGMLVADIGEPMEDVAQRLLAALGTPGDAQVLGAQLVRELHYRLLQGPGGAGLRNLAAWHGRWGQIYRSCEHLRLHYAQNHDVSTLAREAAMSLSAFHQAFRAVTGHSPMQYMKCTRLHKARDLIVTGTAVSQAAYEVGYASASQFSREFKRLFGHPPAELIC